MASLSEVAKHAGVSLTTASIVLNPGKQACRISVACAQRVRAAAEELGYVPNYHAQSMKRGRAGAIAVTLDIGPPGQPSHSELGSSYFGTIIGAIELHARSLGFQTAIVGPDEKLRAPDRGYLGLRQRRFDGLIVPGIVVRPEATSFISDAPMAPIVVVEYSGKTELPVVDWDEAAGLELAIRHLADLGHRELLFLGPQDGDPVTGPTSRETLFMAKAAEAGVRFAACRFDRRSSNYHVGTIADAAEDALRMYLREHKRTFTGVLAYNNVAAIGACGALLEAGLKIPADVSVVGVDDVEASFAIPRLTTVSHKLAEMGRRASELMMQMIEDKEAVAALRGKREVLMPDLVVRKSTGPAKPAA